MNSVYLNLNKVENVGDFVKDVNKLDGSFHLVSKYGFEIDAKSLLGVFTMDLSKPVKMDYEAAEETEVMKVLAPYVA